MPCSSPSGSGRGLDFCPLPGTINSAYCLLIWQSAIGLCIHQLISRQSTRCSRYYQCVLIVWVRKQLGEVRVAAHDSIGLFKLCGSL